MCNKQATVDAKTTRCKNDVVLSAFELFPLFLEQELQSVGEYQIGRIFFHPDDFDGLFFIGHGAR